MDDVLVLDRVGMGPPEPVMRLPRRLGLTVRDLVRERVRLDYETRAAHPLVGPGTQEAGGVEAAIARALDGFEANAFFVLVEGRQAVSLDETLDLTRSGEVVFLRLVPLVGG